MSEPFVKLWGSIRKSSVWLEPHHVFKLWIYMLTEADKEGFVEGSKYAIGHAANLTHDETAEAFDRLEAPDPDSKSKAVEGRRIVAVDDGWVVINKSKYREMRTAQQIATAERVRRYREKQAAGDAALHVTDVTAENDSSTSTSNSGSVVEGKEVQEKREVGDYCTRLAVAANQGLGFDVPRIMASSGSTLQVAEILQGADIPVEFAEQAVLNAATRSRQKDSIRSLSYFTRAVVEAWEKKGLAEQVKDSKLRAGKTQDPEKLSIATATCPICGAVGLIAQMWEGHFRREHPREDTPRFSDNRTP